MASMESFIENVKKFPCLWNPEHISYRDANRKLTAWSTIALKCGMVNGRDAKTQWKRLRDAHREAIRRRNPSAGQSNVIMRPWKYEHLMEFILNPTEPKDPNGLDSLNGTNDFISLDSPGEEESLEAEIRDERQQRREEFQVQRNEARNLMHAVNRFPNDALFSLFTSMYMKTRDLPKSLQLRVQREIFDSVTRAEEEALNMNPGLESSVTPNEANFQECYVYDNLTVKKESD